jgi:hypothetical protein
MTSTIKRYAAAALRTVALLATAGLISSCGGGGGDSTDAPPVPAPIAPIASNLVYTPEGAYQGSADSTVTISGTVDIVDPDGDLAGWTLTILDASGQTLQTIDEPIPDAGGLTSATVVFSIVASTAELGDFTFRLEFVDLQGLRSGPLTGTFRVTERPWASLPGLPLARSGFATASLDGLIYVMGGRDPASVVIPAPPIARVDIYDPATGAWTLGTPMARPMTDFVASAAGGRILAVGPTDSYGLTIETQEFDPLAGVWTVRAPPSGGLNSQGGAFASGRLYTVGGSGGGFDSNLVESFDPMANLWRLDAPMPSARRLLTAVAVDIEGSSRIFALGGYGTTHLPDAGYFRASEVYDPIADAWASRAPMPQPVARAAAVAFDGRIFTFGGENVERAIDAVNRYDPAIDAWTPRAALPAPATGLRAEVVQRRIFVFTSSEIWVYTPDNDVW